jgi:transposase-like protein
LIKGQVKAGMAELVIPPRSGGERSEPERSGGITSPAPPTVTPATEAKIPDPEVNAKATHRQFSSEYKRRILQETASCDSGGIAALLRREGLYSSHLTAWRRQMKQGAIRGLEPHKRGRKAIPRNPLAAENDRLQRENRRMGKRLRQAEIIIDVQKKLCEILGLTVPPIEQNEDDE